MIATILAALGSLGGLVKGFLAIVGLFRDKQLRAEGVREAEHAHDRATLEAVEKANEIESRPKPATLSDSLKRL